mmetsp:Transcript_49254/g.130455  ORF Transcript_49254/g.130455 Transcript_49254/m.130455 type:complete len:238 (-) Transcript_49254:536-1249(-)
MMAMESTDSGHDLSEEAWLRQNGFEQCSYQQFPQPSPPYGGTKVARGFDPRCCSMCRAIWAGLVVVGLLACWNAYGIANPALKEWASNFVGTLERLDPELSHGGGRVAQNPAFNESDCCYQSFSRLERSGKPGLSAWWPWGCTFNTPGPNDYFVKFRNFQNLDDAPFHFTAHVDNQTDVAWMDSANVIRGRYGNDSSTYIGITCDQWVVGCTFAFDLKVCSANVDEDAAIADSFVRV